MGTQYRGGIYYTSEAQRVAAEASKAAYVNSQKIAKRQPTDSPVSFGLPPSSHPTNQRPRLAASGKYEAPIVTEIKPAAMFWHAEVRVCRWTLAWCCCRFMLNARTHL